MTSKPVQPIQRMAAFLKQVFKFLKHYFLTDPGFVWRYSLAFWKKEYKTTASFYSESDFFSQISSGKSIIRMGDGEISLLHGRGIHYQNYTKELGQKLKQVIVEYNEASPYILSIPIFVNHSNDQLRSSPGKLNCWLPLKIEFNRIFNNKMKYLDAHFFYYRDKMLDFFNTFLSDKIVVFVTNAETIQGIEQSHFTFKHKIYIETASHHAFETVADIERKIDGVIAENPGAVLVLSCGPASKYLAFKYSKEGSICYDLGFGLRYLYDTKDYSYVI